MKKILTGMLFCIALHTHAQTNITEINEQVWKPFVKAFEQNDAELFCSLHSRSLIRVQARDLLNYDTYTTNYARMFERMKKEQTHSTITLRFSRRLSDSTRAFEEGYYKMVYPYKGKFETGYGKFTVILTKENGQWKIMLDSDLSDGVNEEVFMSGKEM